MCQNKMTSRNGKIGDWILVKNGIEYPHAKGDFGLWMNYA